MSLVAKQRAAGWIFLAPATIMIAVMSFYPMIRAFIISLQTGAGANMRFADPIFSNYKRIMMDKVFQQSIVNTFLYLIIQVPIMLILAILLAQLLNNKDLKFKGFFRTCVFLPCATSLVSYSLIFRSMFATDGLINSILIKLGILSTGYNFLGNFQISNGFTFFSFHQVPSYCRITADKISYKTQKRFLTCFPAYSPSS